MQKHNRIFIAINLPENIKKIIAKHRAELPEIPIKWVKENNLHITLVFLGHVSYEELPSILKSIKEVSLKSESFSISLNKICYGPISKKTLTLPKMIWATGESSEKLIKLKKDLNNSLSTQVLAKDKDLSSSPIKENINKNFIPHITLGRIRQWEFRKINPEEIPVIEKEIFLNFEVNSIEIMESELKKEGPKYIILESCNFQN